MAGADDRLNSLRDGGVRPTRRRAATNGVLMSFRKAEDFPANTRWSRSSATPENPEGYTPFSYAAVKV